jgi:hypothetical protein
MNSTVRSLRTVAALGFAATTILLFPIPAGAEDYPGEPARVESPSSSSDSSGGLAELQIVLGALGGASLAAGAAGALAINGRRHHAPRPA